MLELIRELLSSCLEGSPLILPWARPYKVCPKKAQVERTCGCCAPLRFSSAIQPQAVHKVKLSLALLVPLELPQRNHGHHRLCFCAVCPSTGSPGGAEQEAVPCSRQGAAAPRTPRVIKEPAVIGNSPASATVSTRHYCLMDWSYWQVTESFVSYSTAALNYCKLELSVA